ncbi:MAG TPA: NAD(P)H-quinone oxidoreductase [Pyrinomonadaceae bacterium]|nr:NAD(P)H-quinone oxidoreductase [Pyrinomonadaceae bacterium]
MRAIKIVSHGGVEGLEVGEVEQPQAAGERVRVRVRAAALNRADLLQRRGLYPAPKGAPASIPGLEFAGEVEALGADAHAWRTGQRVFGITGGGAQAEYVVVPENTLAEIPDKLGWEEAAAVPEAFITAHDALCTQGGLALGERLIVHAAGSGVGLAAIQLARATGAQTFGTARTADKLERARDYGLDEACVVSGDPQTFADAAKAWTGGAGVELILDLVGANYLAANLDALAPRGRLLLVGTMAGTSAPLDFRQVMGKRLRITGTVLRARSAEEKARATRLFAAHVAPLLARGTVRPVIDSVYDMHDIRAAHLRLESNETFGKVVIKVTGDK